MSNTPMQSIDFSALLASSVHDLKNSLHALRELISQLENFFPEQKPDELKHLNFEANRMNNNLMQLLTLYKIGLAQCTPTIDEHYAVDILEDIVDQHSTLLSLGNAELITECDSDLVCYCDSAMISNALCTIVNNAHRYCQSKVLISATQEQDYVVFSIEDDGAGYPENLMSSDEQQLPQVDLGTGNTGLGLFFTRTIARLHANAGKQGFIETDNNSRFGGARFRLYLP